VVAERFFKDNVILCGDSAHSFPPAGGFGMNTGIQDAYNLAYKLSYMMKNDITQEEEEKILTQYWQERSSHSRLNLSTAMRYYQHSLNIAAHLGTSYRFISDQLGLKKENLNMFQGALDSVDKFIPKDLKSKIFEIGKSVGSYHLETL
jgi:2-polyprenyl-6-methoxyphenol hydroxylase-like FAD-dependent oxidoreductase